MEPWKSCCRTDRKHSSSQGSALCTGRMTDCRQKTRVSAPRGRQAVRSAAVSPPAPAERRPPRASRGRGRTHARARREAAGREGARPPPARSGRCSPRLSRPGLPALVCGVLGRATGSPRGAGSFPTPRRGSVGPSLVGSVVLGDERPQVSLPRLRTPSADGPFRETATSETLEERRARGRRGDPDPSALPPSSPGVCCGDLPRPRPDTRVEVSGPSRAAQPPAAGGRGSSDTDAGAPCPEPAPGRGAHEAAHGHACVQRPQGACAGRGAPCPNAGWTSSDTGRATRPSPRLRASDSAAPSRTCGTREAVPCRTHVLAPKGNMFFTAKGKEGCFTVRQSAA